jgi:hypothetical protein
MLDAILGMCEGFLRSRNEHFTGSRENNTDVRAIARQHGIEDHVKFIFRDSCLDSLAAPLDRRERRLGS